MENSYAVLTDLFEVFNQVSAWLIDAMESVGTMFFDGTNFTWLGLLTLVSLGISIVFLIIGVIRAFIRFR